jgi:predicted ATP-grasp superfamily ATP-dependent carboligase
MTRLDVSLPVVVLGFSHGGLGVARSLGRLGVPVHGVDPDPRAAGFASRYCRTAHVWDCERAPTADTLAFLKRLGSEVGRALLIPTMDAGAVLVADHADALAPYFLFPRQPPALVRALSDKRGVSQLARQFGIPSPAVSFPACADDVRRFASGARFPVVLKGIDTARLERRTGYRLAIVQDSRELLDRYMAWDDPAQPNLMLQEYIPGGDDTVWMFNGYFNARSECLAAFTGRKLRQYPPHRGPTSLGVCEHNETVERLTIAFMQAIGYRGVLDIGYRYDSRDGLYKLLDPNPRIGATFRLFVDEWGMDVARCLYRDVTGQPVPRARMRAGRKWIVEDWDLESSLTAVREGTLTLRGWLGSLRGNEEVDRWH